MELFRVDVEITLPPTKTAVLSAEAAINPTRRDQRIAAIRTDGHMVWQVSSGYNQRSRGETQMGRRKQVIGPKMKARCFRNQQIEVKIGTRILNKMNGFGHAKFESILRPESWVWASLNQTHIYATTPSITLRAIGV